MTLNLDLIDKKKTKEIIHGSHSLYTVLTWVTLFSNLIAF